MAEQESFAFTASSDSMLGLIAGNRPARCEEEDRFYSFHLQNPRVMEFFDRFSQQMISRGYSRCSQWFIMNRVRWEIAIKTKGEKRDNPDDPELKLKIANGYIAYYARLWLEMYPEHDGFFRLRKLKVEQ